MDFHVKDVGSVDSNSLFLEDIDEGSLGEVTSYHCYFEDFQQLGYDALYRFRALRNCSAGSGCVWSLEPEGLVKVDLLESFSRPMI